LEAQIRLPEKRSTEYGLLQELARDFWQWRAIHQPLSYDDIPRIERPPGWVPDWSSQAISKRHDDMNRFHERWRQIDSASWSVSQKVDYRLIGSALARVQWELQFTRSHEIDPDFYVAQTLGSIYLLLLKPPPFDSMRSSEIVRRMSNIPRTVKEAKANLENNPVRAFALAAIEKLADVRNVLTKVVVELKPFLTPDFIAQLELTTDPAITALAEFRDWLEARLPMMSPETGVGRDSYVFFLRHVALMPFTPEQLMAMSRQEWERSIAFETFEEVRNSGLPELSLFPDQAAQMKREEELEHRVREFLETKNIISVPKWVCHYRNLPVPHYVEPLAFMGVTDDLTPAQRLDEDGISYIKVPSPNLDYFSLSIAKDPRPLIVHEGVPGHYFQLALSWAHENFIRRYYYDSGANEGIGFYAEELMLQFGLFDDRPRTREIMYNYMRLRALRVEVDVKLALGLFTIEQAANYLQDVAGLDRATAWQEATFFASAPGQAITYQIGKLQILKFLADSKSIQGDKFNLRAFHDFAWKNGNVPIALQRWEYLGLDDEMLLIDDASKRGPYKKRISK
jgi:uncharacterized protein (DUF885 family)